MLVILGLVEKPDRQLLCRIWQSMAPMVEYRLGTAWAGDGRRDAAVRSQYRPRLKREEAGQNPGDWAGAQPDRVW